MSWSTPTRLSKKRKARISAFVGLPWRVICFSTKQKARVISLRLVRKVVVFVLASRGDVCTFVWTGELGLFRCSDASAVEVSLEWWLLSPLSFRGLGSGRRSCCTSCHRLSSVRWLWLMFTCNHSQKVPKLCCVGGGFIFKIASTILVRDFTAIGFKQLPSHTVSLTVHSGFVELCSDCTSISKLGKRTNTYRRHMIMIKKIEDNRTSTESVHATSCQWWTVDINQGVYIIAFAFSGSAVPRLRSRRARSIFFIFSFI